MSRFALVAAAALLFAPAPAFAQGSQPTKKTPDKKTPDKKTSDKKTSDKKKAGLTKDKALKLAHSFFLALEKKDVKKAMTFVHTPFLVVADNKLIKWDKATLEKMLAGEFGRRSGERADSFRKKSADKMVALYWGPKSKRGINTVKAFPDFKGCGWVGVVYDGKKKQAEVARKPFAFKVVEKKLVIIGFHDD